jgi:hypothetical protein
MEITIGPKEKLLKYQIIRSTLVLETEYAFSKLR